MQEKSYIPRYNCYTCGEEDLHSGTMIVALLFKSPEIRAITSLKPLCKRLRMISIASMQTNQLPLTDSKVLITALIP